MTWQQARQTLNRWAQQITVRYKFALLILLKPESELAGIMSAPPWRKAGKVTAGEIHEGLSKYFMKVYVLSWRDTTLKKIRATKLAILANLASHFIFS